MTTTTTRRRYGLEALLEERPEELRCWVTDAPLKLVAAALIDIGGMAKKRAIIESIPRELFDGNIKADPWWKRVRPAIAESTKYFEIKKDGRVNFRRSHRIDDIPAEPLLPKQAKSGKNKQATLTDWRKWLQSDVAEPPPGAYPTKVVSNTLSKWPVETIERALDRTMYGAEEFLAYGRIPKRAAEGWLESVGRASLRWIGCKWPHPDRYLAVRASELLQILATYTKDAGEWLFLSNALSGQWRSHEERLTQQQQEQERQRISYESQLAQQQQEQERQRISYESQLAQQLVSHEKHLGQMQQEEAHLRQQIQTLNSMLASKREESRLDIRRDMLLAVGEALQLMYQQREHSEVSLRDLEAGLVLALGAGGAQLLETADSSVEYNPFRHKLEGQVAEGTPVRVLAPGVIVPSSILGDAVLLKARARQISRG